MVLWPFWTGKEWGKGRIGQVFLHFKSTYELVLNPDCTLKVQRGCGWNKAERSSPQPPPPLPGRCQGGDRDLGKLCCLHLLCCSVEWGQQPPETTTGVLMVSWKRPSGP